MNRFKDLFKNIIKNKKIFILFICGMLLVVIFLIFILFGDSEIISLTRYTDGGNIKEQYEKLNGKESEDGKLYPEVKIPSNNVLKYSNVDEILKIFNNKEDAVIYLGNPTCLYCRSAIEILCYAADSTSIDVIYYLEVEDDMDKYNELVNILDDRFIVKEVGKKKVYLPIVIFVVDGNIVSHNKGTLFSQSDPYQELDKYQIEGLSEIYKDGINDVLNG